MGDQIPQKVQTQGLFKLCKRKHYVLIENSYLKCMKFNYKDVLYLYEASKHF